MTPYEAFANGTPLLVEVAGTERPVAAIWPVLGGLRFADIGWDTNDWGHPFHTLAGPVEGEQAPWRVGAAIIRPIFPFDPAMLDWQRWQDYLAEHPDVTPALAQQIGGD